MKRNKILLARDRLVENIPPTQGLLIQHVHRATFQVDYIWGQPVKLIT